MNVQQWAVQDTEFGEINRKEDIVIPAHETRMLITQVCDKECEALKQEVQALELFERRRVLPQELFISYDFLSQDAQVLHAQLKKSC